MRLTRGRLRRSGRGGGFSGFVCANAALASATLIASAAALKRMTGNLNNRPFEP